MANNYRIKERNGSFDIEIETEVCYGFFLNKKRKEWHQTNAWGTPHRDYMLVPQPYSPTFKSFSEAKAQIESWIKDQDASPIYHY